MKGAGVQVELRKARSMIKKGRAGDAMALLRSVLQRYPSNKPALKELAELEQRASASEQIRLRNHYSSGRLEQALELAKELTDQYPSVLFFWEILGVAAAQLNQFVHAEVALKRGLQISPNNSDLMNNLANVYRFQGKLNEAFELYKKALAINPRAPDACNNLGCMFRDKGNINRAIELHNRAVQIRPEFPEAYNNLGLAYRQNGQFDQALVYFQKALDFKPDYADAFSNMGLTYKNNEDVSSALSAFEKAITLDPYNDNFHLNLGNLQRELGDYEGAITSLLTATELNSKGAESFNSLGVAIFEKGNELELDKAKAALQTAISLDGNFAEPHFNLGNIYRTQANFNDAKLAFERAIFLQPDHASAYNNLALLLKDLGDTVGAIRSFNTSINLSHENISAMSNLATTFYELGQSVDCKKMHHKILSVNPSYVPSLRHLADMEVAEALAPIADDLVAVLREQTCSNEELSEAAFGLYRIYERQGSLDKAFEYLSESKNYRIQSSSYRLDTELELVDRVLEEGKGWLRHSVANDSGSVAPIFIVGMPRSGTTLVEQIISNHSLVSAGGELPHLSEIVTSLMKQGREQQDNVEHLRSEYMLRTANLTSGVNSFTDKMPQNFLYLSMAAASLPNARFVHVFRSPQATCWSIFSQFFTAGLGFSLRLADTVHYYNKYVEVMRSLPEALKQRVFHINYEALVDNPQSQIADLLQWLSLPAEEDCYRPHLNSRLVRTASSQQVRKPIYRSSSDSWKKYAPYIGDVFEEISTFKPG